MPKVPLDKPFLMFRQPDNADLELLLNGETHLLRSNESVEANMVGVDLQNRAGFATYNDMAAEQVSTLLDEQNTHMQGQLQPPVTLKHWQGFPRPVVEIKATQSPYKILKVFLRRLKYSFTFTLSRKIGYDLVLGVTICIPVKKETVSLGGGGTAILNTIKSIKREVIIPAGQTASTFFYEYELLAEEKSEQLTYITVEDRPETRFKGPHRLDCVIGLTSEKPVLTINRFMKPAPEGLTIYAYTIHSSLPASGLMTIQVVHTENHLDRLIGDFIIQPGNQVSDSVEVWYSREDYYYPVSIEIAAAPDYTLGSPYKLLFLIR